MRGCANSVGQEVDVVGDQKEPLVPSMLVLLFVMFDSDEDERPTARPTPRAIAIEITTPSRKSFHGLTCVWCQDRFRALLFSNILSSMLRGVSREATTGLSVRGLRNGLQ